MFRINLWLVFLISVFLLSGCSAVQQNVSSGSTSENNPDNISTPTPIQEKLPKSVADENFEKEWKSKYETISAELERNHRLWQESKIVNYDFEIAKYAGGVTNHWNRLPVLIKIRDNEKNSIEKVDKDKDYVVYSKTDGFEDFDTIDKLFNYLRQELEKGKILYVKYNKKLGYPQKTTIEDSYEIHGDRSIVIEKFKVIK